MPPFDPFRRTRVLGTALAAFAGVALCGTAQAQMFEPKAVLEDTKLYFTAPLRWDHTDWLYFGSTLAAVAVAHEFDDNVRNHFVADPAAAIGTTDPQGKRDALPALALAAGTVAYAALIHSKDGYYETGTMLEAGILTAASTTVFKYALGRERPHDTLKVDSWFASGDSFPSGHASLAFAVGTVFAESGSDRYRWIRRGLGYGAAGLTAYWRVKGNAHWTSDVVAGAALGFTTAQFVMNRRDHSHQRVSTSIVPVDGGLALAFSLPLN
ncbi:MAG: phosphatase PAP2 family protein [Steroidobacteraceae bacterium]